MTTQCPKCKAENPDESKFCNECGLQMDSIDKMPAPPTQTLEVPKEELTTGSTFAGRYQIIEELGRGGMGRVYKATDTKINEKVALKLIKPEIASDKKTLERFGNELRIARKIVHKNVGRMYDINEEEGTHYITMEYVSGQDLKGFIRQSGQMGIGTALSITKQVCEGLSEAHKTGVIHRDLKPSNIMIDREGNVRIMDFGIARSLKEKGITGAGIMIGTPEYMSPEQAEAKELDQRSDIYSLGVILYEMVTGRVPFEGDTALSIAMKHKSEAPKDPKEYNAQIPDDVSDLILKCLEKNKDSRYQSAGEIQSELENIAKGIPTTDREIPKRKPITSKEITVTFGLKKLLVPVLVFIGIVFIGIIIWQILPKMDAVSVSPSKPSVAVLAFEDLSPNKDQGYLCEGFAESLINVLARVEDLRVPAPTSSFSFKSKELDMQEIGEKLKVKTVLRGSIQKAGNRIRITALLINVDDESLLWSEQYNRELEDVFAIQDEISFAIVDKLKVELLGEEKSRLTKRYTESIKAYNLYLQGRFFWNKRTEDGLNNALTYFGKAIEQDTNYALAYAGLADTYSMLNGYGFLHANEAFPKAKAQVLKALAIDNKLAEAHTSLAWIKMSYDWDWGNAEREYLEAIRLNPNYPIAHLWYAYYLMYTAQFDKAIEEINLAYELDPLSLVINRAVGNVYFYARRYDKAAEAFQKTIMMDPNFSSAHRYLGEVYLQDSKYEDALTAFQKEMDLKKRWNPGVQIRIGITYAKMGKKREALRVFEDVREKSKQMLIPKMYMASLCFALGEKDQGFKWLERGYEERELSANIKTTPYLDNVRSDPRYMAILKKMNLE